MFMKVHILNSTYDQGRVKKNQMKPRWEIDYSSQGVSEQSMGRGEVSLAAESSQS